MVPPIAAINGADTTHSQNEQENVDVRARPWTLLVAHPPRVLNETGSDGAEGASPRMAGRYLSFEVTGARCAEDGISFSKDTQTGYAGEGPDSARLRRLVVSH